MNHRLWVRWLVVACVALASGSRSVVAAAPCGPVADVVGDAALVAGVRDLLAQRGVTPPEDSDCPKTTAAVLVTAAGIHVSVSDAAGRGTARVVSDIATAATIIESWARGDIDDPRFFERAPEPAPATPSGERKNKVVNARGPLSVAAGLHVSRDGSAAIWLEPELAMSWSLGDLAVGTLLRGRFDIAASGTSERLDTVRLGVDVLATVELPVRLGDVVLCPGLGLGAGWLRSDFNSEDAEGQDVDSGGIRMELRVGLRIPVDVSTKLELVLRGNLSPLAHATVYAEDGLALAGEAAWSVGLGIGVRFGGPP